MLFRIVADEVKRQLNDDKQRTQCFNSIKANLYGTKQLYVSISISRWYLSSRSNRTSDSEPLVLGRKLIRTLY